MVASFVRNFYLVAMMKGNLNEISCSIVCMSFVSYCSVPVSAPFVRQPFHLATKTSVAVVAFFFSSFLVLIGFEIFREPVHHLINCLIQPVLFQNSSFISPPFLVIPSKPAHGMKSITLEDVSSMERTVVVYQQNITRFHGQCRNVLFACSFNLHAIL